MLVLGVMGVVMLGRGRPPLPQDAWVRGRAEGGRGRAIRKSEVGSRKVQGTSSSEFRLPNSEFGPPFRMGTSQEAAVKVD